MSDIDDALARVSRHNGVWCLRSTTTPVWLTEDFRLLETSQMETRHIRNCLAQILLRANDGWRAAYIPLLVAELKRRGNT